MPEFLNPGFLWALPAVFIPVVIHLLHRRRRYRRVPWAAMQHLLAAQQSNRRRIRLRNLLLLLMRCAAVAAIVLLLSRPLLGHAAVPPGAAAGEVFVLLDDSASMACRSGGRSAFERGRRFVQRLAGRVEAARGEMTLLTPSRPEPLLEPGSARDVAEVLEGLAVVGAPLEPEEDLPRLAAAAAGRGAGDPAFWIVTDLRRADWGAETLSAAARRALQELQDYGPVHVVDVGAEPEGTAGVTDISMTGRFAYVDETAAFRVEVSNDLPEPLEEARLIVELNGRALPAVRVPEVPPGEKRVVPLNVHVTREGDHELTVWLDVEDAFAPDDIRWHVFRGMEEVPVLIVEGRDGAADFLSAALRPMEGAGLRPEVRSAARGLPEELNRYAAVFLCDLRSPPARAEELGRWMAEGGRLVVFAGPNTEERAWAEADALPDGLLPAAIGQAVTPPADDPVRLTELDFSDPLLAPFEGWEALFGDARFAGFRRLRPRGGARGLARFSDPDASPALVAHGVGEGLAVVVASSADDEWHDWPRSEAGRISYVALFSWLVEQGEPPGPPRNLEAGRPLRWRLEAGRFRSQGTVQPPAPEGEPQSAPVPLPGEHAEDRPLTEFTSAPLRHTGFGRVNLVTAGGEQRVKRFAVNLPERERRLARLPRETVAAADVRGRLSVTGYEPADDDPARAEAEPWRTLAGLLLGLLVAESLLAWRFGNPPGSDHRGREGGP